MQNRNHSIVCAVACLAVLLSGSAATGNTQSAKSTPPKTPEHQQGMKGMQGMQGMQAMMASPHQQLAMAHRQNLMTFATMLRSDVIKSKSVNSDVARPAVAEIRHSFDAIRQHHEAQSPMIGNHADSAMTAMKRHMESHLSALSGHLTALEAEVARTTADAAPVRTHLDAILKECAGMAPMHAQAKPHQMK